MENNKVVEFFGNLNLTILPANVAEYIKTQIIADNDISLMGDDDEDFVEVKNFIEENYPLAIAKSGAEVPVIEQPAAPAEPIVEEPVIEEPKPKTISEQIGEIEGLIGGYKLKMGRAKGEDKERYKDTIAGFELKLKRLKSKKESGGDVVVASASYSRPEDKQIPSTEVIDFSLSSNDPSHMADGGEIHKGDSIMINKFSDPAHEKDRSKYIGKELVVLFAKPNGTYEVFDRATGDKVPFDIDPKELVSYERYGWGGDLLKRSKELAQKGLGKIGSGKPSHPEEPTNKKGRYTLGDFNSDNFDHKGMLELASTVSDKWSTVELERLFLSLNDSNHRSLGDILLNYINSRKQKDANNEKIFMDKFLQSIKSELSKKYADGGGIEKNGDSTSASDSIRNTLDKINEILRKKDENWDEGLMKVTLPSIYAIDIANAESQGGTKHKWLTIEYGDSNIALINEVSMKEAGITESDVELIADFAKANNPDYRESSENMDSLEYAKSHREWEAMVAADKLPEIGDLVDTRGWTVYARSGNDGKTEKGFNKLAKKADDLMKSGDFVAIITEDAEQYYLRTRETKSQVDETRIYAKGGGFEKLSREVSKEYFGQHVPKKYQSEYGKTYTKEGAEEVGKRVAAKVYRKQQSH